MATTQLDVLNAQLALFQNQLTNIDLQAAAQKARVNLQIAQTQVQIAAQPADPS